MRMVRKVLAVCLLALVASLTVAASAMAETEPANNRFTGADGPLADNVTVNASLSASGDQDWYYFYVGATGDFTVSNTAYTVFYEYVGGTLHELWYMFSGAATPRQLGPGLYYIRVCKDNPPKAYALTVAGPTSDQPPGIASTHRPATLMSEIYESATTGFTQAQLVTPYAENLATIGATGDVDWYKFYVTDTCDVTVGQWTPQRASLCLYADPTDAELVWFNSSTTASTTRQLARGTYYIKVFGGSLPAEYTFTVQGQYVSTHAPSVLTTPRVMGKALAKSKTTFTGLVLPGRAALVKVQIQILSTKYSDYKAIDVNSASTGTWSTKVKLKKGTYRVRATTAATPGYTDGSSAWRKVVVK